MPAMWITAGSALLGALSSGDKAQGGTTTESRNPWGPAQPWMQQQIATGQNLQNYYQQNPFNQQQLNAYSNLRQGTDYMNALTPSLLQQFGQHRGFDRSNPRQGPAAFNFSANPGMGGNLGFGGVSPQQAMPQPQQPQYNPAPQPPPMIKQPPSAWEDPLFSAGGL